MDNFVIKDSPGKGKGLFATKNFGKNEILFKFEGIKVLKQYAWTHPESEKLLQIGPELYLDVAGHFSIFTNHSCKPNCFVKISLDNAFLYSYLPIKIGDELTFDYSTTSTDSPYEWSMPCHCSIFGCRGNISGFHSLSESQQKLYMERGIVPYYLKG